MVRWSRMTYENYGRNQYHNDSYRSLPLQRPVVAYDTVAAAYACRAVRQPVVVTVRSDRGMVRYTLDDQAFGVWAEEAGRVAFVSYASKEGRELLEAWRCLGIERR
jgi:hypothetical protein